MSELAHVIIFGLVLVAVAATLQALIILWLIKLVLFRRPDQNPYRRVCCHCGARHEYHTRTLGDPHGWWEEMRPGNPELCLCRLFVDNKRY